MAKLKYDRPINIDSGSDRNITIPNDEVWKVTTREGDVPASPKLYGGGTHSVMGLFPASPSSTSTSKRRRGGDAPWLKNLSLIDRCRLSLKKIARLLFLQVKCGKYVPTNAAMTLICSYMMETFAQSIELLVRVRCLKALVAHLSQASLLKSSSNNIVEGVTLYA